MRDVCYRDLDKAQGKAEHSLRNNFDEAGVRLLLKALKVKVELTCGLEPPSKNDLVMLLNQKGLANDVREVVANFN